MGGNLVLYYTKEKFVRVHCVSAEAKPELAVTVISLFVWFSLDAREYILKVRSTIHSVASKKTVSQLIRGGSIHGSFVLDSNLID